MEQRRHDQRSPTARQSRQREIEHRAQDRGGKGSRRAKCISTWLECSSSLGPFARGGDRGDGAKDLRPYGDAETMQGARRIAEAFRSLPRSIGTSGGFYRDAKPRSAILTRLERSLSRSAHTKLNVTNEMSELFRFESNERNLGDKLRIIAVLSDTTQTLFTCPCVAVALQKPKGNRKFRSLFLAARGRSLFAPAGDGRRSSGCSRGGPPVGTPARSGNAVS